MTISLQSRIEGAVLGAAIGDAMGHPTKFINSFEGIFNKYGPQGVTGFRLFWTREGKRFAPYTDDTQMAEVVLRALVESERLNRSRRRSRPPLRLRYTNSSLLPRATASQHPDITTAEKAA
jgi:ADP-ribosylglycohydrolase